MRPRHAAVSRRKAAVGVLLALGVLAGIVAGTEALRHPPPGGVTPALVDEGDPRLPVVCEEPQPREGVERDEQDLDATAHRVSSNDLYDCPQTWDGRLVRYQGEAVGAVLRRSGGAWVHLNDDVYADLRGPLPAHRDYRGGNAGVGVFVPDAVAEQIEVVGGPQARGDLIEVVGRFHRVDRATREVAVIRADTGTVVRAGGPVDDPLLPDRAIAAAVLVPIALACLVGERVHARRARMPRR